MDRPVELEGMKYPDYLAKWEIFSSYRSIPQSRRLHACIILMPKVGMYAKERKSSLGGGS